MKTSCDSAESVGCSSLRGWSPHSLLPVALLALLTSAAVSAQSNPTESRGPADSEEVITLSPFVVSEDEDLGYAASSTLAGTRLNTNLRDVGSAVSIVTAEFLADTGTTNIQDLLVYTTSTEVGGVSGNFANASVTGGRADQDNARTDPSSNTRIRGLSGANQSRDYFLTDIPMDGYNTTGVTIARGPNSILFGIGSPGGVIENSLKKAMVNRDRGEASFRFGARGSSRATADYNKVLLKNRLAIRVNALKAHTYYQQEPADEREERIFLAATAVLRQDKGDAFLGSTTLRANFEAGNTDGVPPNVIPPTDNIYAWFVPLDADALEAVTGVTIPANLRPDATWRPQSTRNNLQQSLSSAPYTGTVTRNFLFNQFGVIWENGATQPGISFADPSIPANAARGNIPYVRARDGRNQITWNGANNVVDSVYVPGFTGSTLQNRDIFDFENHLITGDVSRRTSDFDAKAISLEQLFLKGKAGIEVAYDQQHFETFTNLPFGSGRQSDIWVDISEYLTNDQPNPNVGRAVMMDVQNPFRYRFSDQEVMRATAFYDLDFRDQKDGWKQWLGRHVFTGLYSDQSLERSSENYNHSWMSDDFDILGATGLGVTSFPRAVVNVVYLSDDLRNAASYDDVRLNQMNITMPTIGDSFTTWYMDPVTRKVAYGDVYVDRFLSGGDITRQEFESQAFSWQSYLLNDNLVGLWGWRRDSAIQYSRMGNAVLPDGSYDPANLQLDPVASSDISGNTSTWSLVGHLPYELPYQSYLSAHFAKSENFSPTGLRRNVYNEVLPADTGSTREYGVTLNMLDGKLIARANWFETDNQNVSDAGASSLANTGVGWIRGWLTRAIAGELAGTPYAESPTGLAGIGTSYADLYRIIAQDILPPETAAAYNFRVENGAVQSDQVSGLSEVTNAVSKGFEFELIANPTRQWRVSVNVAEQETVKSDSVIALSQFSEAVIANLAKLGLTNVDDAPQEAGTSPFGNRWDGVVGRPLKAFQVKDGTVSQEQRKWRVNGVSTYRFNDGRLKGVLVGGAYRWQDKAAVGYKLLLDENKQQYPDLASPFYAAAETNIDFWVGYSRKIRKNLDWTIQLNVRNAFGADDLIPVITNPDGVVAVARIPQEKNWFITNTFKF